MPKFILVLKFIQFYLVICITKTYLYKFDPRKPHFYIVKLGFTGVYIILLFLLKGGSNEYPQSMFWAEIWKISDFYLKNCHFLVVKFSIYLNRRVFVMANNEAPDQMHCSAAIDWHYAVGLGLSVRILRVSTIIIGYGRMYQPTWNDGTNESMRMPKIIWICIFSYMYVDAVYHNSSLNVLVTTAADILNLFVLFRQNKAWHFMWLVSRADDSHEIPYFLCNTHKNQNVVCFSCD